LHEHACGSPEDDAFERLAGAICGLEHELSEPPTVRAFGEMFDAIARKAEELTVRLDALDGLSRKAEDDVPEDDMLAESIDFEGFGDYFPADWGEGGEDE
jgi:uncharacterized protein (DUF1800 family)